jgi:hypothetical protein
MSSNMSLTYQHGPSSSSNTQLRRLLLLVISALCLLSAGCLSAVPQYVRGDFAARSSAPISRSASYSIAHAHFAEFEDRAIAAQINELLRDSLGVRPASAADADIWIDFSHTVSGGGDTEPSPPASFWDVSRAIFQTPSAPSRRFAIEVSRPNTTGGAIQVLWRGEVLTDGASRELSTLADPYLRRILSGFGKDVSSTSFSFRVNDASANARARRASAAVGPTAPALPTRSSGGATSAAPALELPGAKPAEVVAQPTLVADPTLVAQPAPVAVATTVADAPHAPEAEPMAPVTEAPPSVAPVAVAVAVVTPPAVEPAPLEQTRVAETTAKPIEKTAAPRARQGRQPTSMFEALFGATRVARAPELPPRVQRAPARAPATATNVARRPVSEPNAGAPARPDPSPQRPTPGPRPPRIVAAAEPPELSGDELPATPEYAEVGPTWLDALSLCDGLSERPDVNCSLYVEVGSSSPFLELDYATRDGATEKWEADARAVGGAFCITAARHGLYGSAIVVVRAEGAEANRKCKDLPR